MKKQRRKHFSGDENKLRKYGAVTGRDRLVWRTDGRALSLHLHRSRRALIRVEPDGRWPGMFRIRSADGLSDMTNLSRAKDAAVATALRSLNTVQEKVPRGTHVRQRRSPDPNQGLPGAAHPGRSA
jgi:hypothetical protein